MTGGVHQSSAVQRGHCLASSRRRRAILKHTRLYAFSMFSRVGWDATLWRPQRASLQGDARYPLQGFVQAIDAASWLRYNRINEGVNLQLIGAVPPRGLPPNVPHKACPRPPPAATGARSSIDSDGGGPGTQPKGKASALFTMRLSSKPKRSQ